MLYIGIDLGTSACKLLLVDEKGCVRNTVSKEYPLCFPHPGWSEQDPGDWWTACREGMPELLAGFDAREVRGMGVGGQMHGLVALDETDAVLRPAILWNDGRTAEETAWLNDTVGRPVLSARTGNIAFAGFTAPKLLWMKKHEPELFARIRKIMLPKDYLVYCLTGVHATDYSDASGMLLLDVEHKCWSRDMLALCGISESQMPRLYESFAPVGTLLPETAAALGLPQGVTVCAGAGDNAAAAVGTGTVSTGAAHADSRCNISLGTSGTIFISSEKFGVDATNGLHAFAHADGGWHLMGCMLSAASCNNWWMKDILHSDDFVNEQKPLEEDGRLGENHVYFLPYLMGERSPHNDPSARAAFIGMSMDTDRADMLQAVFEGVAYGLRDSLEVAKSLGVAPKSTTICGGGAKSVLWRKIVANVMNMQVDTVEVEEGPAYGGAILAAVANGCFENVEAAAAAIVRKKDTTMPSPQLVEKYEKGYAKFKQFYPALKGKY